MRKWPYMTLLVASVLATTAPCALASFVADRLVDSQEADGSWALDEIRTGAIVAGLVNAYEVFGAPAYKTSAEAGGTYILSNSPMGFFGEDAYALTRLSDIAPDPGSNPWRTGVESFCSAVSTGFPGGTDGHIAALTDPNYVEPSDATVGMAHHVVAAYAVDAADNLTRGGTRPSLAARPD